MTDFSALLSPDRGQKARAIHLVDKNSFEKWVKGRPPEDRALLDAHRFDGKKALAFVLLPRGGDFEVVSAVANADSLSPWCLATLGERLPEGTYKLASGEPGKAALGWLLAQHRFDAYRSKPEADCGPRVLVTGHAASIDQTIRLAEATAIVRDLVDTPAADLGPAELEQAAREEGGRSGAHVRVTTGDKLAKEYPLIAAGEFSSPRPSRLRVKRNGR
jgi:leucyl aminopeptidase